jgi:hypothetical protein
MIAPPYSATPPNAFMVPGMVEGPRPGLLFPASFCELAAVTCPTNQNPVQLRMRPGHNASSLPPVYTVQENSSESGLIAACLRLKPAPPIHYMLIAHKTLKFFLLEILESRY